MEYYIYQRHDGCTYLCEVMNEKNDFVQLNGRCPDCESGFVNTWISRRMLTVVVVLASENLGAGI